MFLCIVFFLISLCNRPFTQWFLSMLSCHWYLIWSILNNSKSISKRRFQGCRRETCRRASPPENLQILQQDIMGKGKSCTNWRNKIIWFVTAISPHNWCQTQILHPKRHARLFQICYKYISGGKTYHDIQLGKSSLFKTWRRLFLSHCWTKNWSDNYFEIVLTSRVA